MKIKYYLLGLLVLFVFMLPLNTGAEIAEAPIVESMNQKTDEITNADTDHDLSDDVEMQDSTSQIKEPTVVDIPIVEKKDIPDSSAKTKEQSQDITQDSTSTNGQNQKEQQKTKLQQEANEPVAEDKPAEDAPKIEDTEKSEATTPSEIIIINEIMIGSEINNAKDVWIEFYNPGSEEIRLDKWKIKGVTKGGSWIDIVNKSDLTIKSNGYFLFSYYSNSRSSALDIKPDMQKSSLLFPNSSIEIQIKDPNEKIIDTATYDDAKQFPIGIPYVIVNGSIAVKNENCTGIFAGQAVP